LTGTETEVRKITYGDWLKYRGARLADVLLVDAAARTAFDLLWRDGKDLRDLPLFERKKLLRKLLPRPSRSVLS
jgi:ATP-dependent DNA ligase